MRIAIFDGDPRGRGTALDQAVTAFAEQAAANGDRCQRLRLAEMKVHQCVGCFACWVRTPGRCRLRDDGERLVAAAAGADLLVFAAPLRMGFVASLLKRANDRMIPVFLPYVDVVDGECHHPMRYEPFDLALIVERGDASADEIAATEQIYRRMAKNMAGKLAWSKVVDTARAEGFVPASDARKGQGHALGTH